MANPTSIVLKSLSILLGVFFVFMGIMKISPMVSKELHRDLRKHYVKYAKVFPLSTMFDIKIPSKWYRRGIGSVEIACGALMAIIPNYKVKNIANVTLLLTMLLAIYSHYMVSDPFERVGPSLVFSFMLIGRLVIWFQIDRKEKQMAEAAQVNGVKQD